jgi:hypothetical protein
MLQEESLSGGFEIGSTSHMLFYVAVTKEFFSATLAKLKFQEQGLQWLLNMFSWYLAFLCRAWLHAHTTFASTKHIFQQLTRKKEKPNTCS